MIREISFYLPNTPGQFSRTLKALAEADVNVRGFSVDISGAFSKFHLICGDGRNIEKAIEQLGLWGYQVEAEEVFALEMPDKPGALLRVMELWGDSNINVDYGYVTQGSPTAEVVLIVLKTDNVALAQALLRQLPDVKDHDRIPS